MKQLYIAKLLLGCYLPQLSNNFKFQFHTKFGNKRRNKGSLPSVFDIFFAYLATRNEIHNFGQCDVVDQVNSSPTPGPWDYSSPSSSSCVAEILNITTNQIIRSRTDPFNIEHPNNYPDNLCQKWELRAPGPEQVRTQTLESI